MKTGIFFDVDGTLRDMKTSVIPKSTLRALRGLENAGYFLGIATGRAKFELVGEIMDLAGWDAFVCNNGQTVYTKKEGLILEKTISPAAAARCVRTAEKMGRPAQVMTADGRTYLTAPADNRVREAYALFGLEPPGTEPYRGEKLVSLMVFGDRGYDFSDYTAIDGITVYPGQGPYADITLAGTSKRTGIEAVTERCGLCGYIAFGDALNDLEMFMGAKISVAMGNAHPEALAAASYRTAPVLGDGIERACKALGLYGGAEGGV